MVHETRMTRECHDDFLETRLPRRERGDGGRAGPRRPSALLAARVRRCRGRRTDHHERRNRLPHRALEQLRRCVRAPRARRRRTRHDDRPRGLGHEDHLGSAGADLPSPHLRARPVADLEHLQPRPRQVPLQAGRTEGLGEVATHQLGRGDQPHRRELHLDPAAAREEVRLDRPVHGLPRLDRGGRRSGLPVRERHRRLGRRLRGRQRGRLRHARRLELRARRPDQSRRTEAASSPATNRSTSSTRRPSSSGPTTSRRRPSPIGA